MTSSPSSGLSAEAKEFVPLVHTPTASIPLYVDENTVASVYPSDQPAFMVQTIYPMMISNAKMIELSTNNLSFPEIEFHIQPSQQQQFHIDSCSNSGQSSSTSSTSTNASQIVLLPTTTGTATASVVTQTGYYPPPQIIYSPNEPVPAYYPIDYCDQPLINFSVQQSNLPTKSNRIPSRLPRPTSFRSQHGNNSTSYRTGAHHTSNYPNRNSYYDYHPRRNGTNLYPSHSGRGNSSNSKRISSSYHQQDYNNYYHHSPTRSRGYTARSSQYHDDQRQNQSDYYHPGKDFYDNEYQQTNELNEDETPFEFRPEDFPSLPINHQSDKTPSQTTPTTMTRSTSSWNAIVSAPRPHSTSPHSLAPSSVQSQDQRSDRSRSFNMAKTPNHPNSTKKFSRSTTIAKSKSPSNASKLTANEESQTNSSKSSTKVDAGLTKDDGFMQTKQQQRRLKRKNRIKEDFFLSNDERSLSPSDEQKFGISTSDRESEHHSTVTKNKSSELIENIHKIDLNDRSSSTVVELQKDKSDTRMSAISSVNNEKSFEEKFSINSKVNIDQSTVNHVEYQTDTNGNCVEKEDDQNSTSFTSSTNNSSDTSDYDDAVDNLAEE